MDHQDLALEWVMLVVEEHYAQYNYPLKCSRGSDDLSVVLYYRGGSPGLPTR